MNRKSVLIAGIVAVLATSMSIISVSGDASGETSQMNNKPLYKTDCAHGHNSFKCEPSKFKTDISDLQEKTVELEKRVAQLEKR